MIPLSCPSCQLKLKINDRSSDKKVRCPKCHKAFDIFPATTDLQQVGSEDATVCPRAASDATFEPNTEHSNGQAEEEPRELLKAEATYEVEGEIARGGMGAIMKAVDQEIRREVAVKFLLNHADSKQKARFVEEAQITGQLEHPNIVPIHQLGEHQDGRCFFSMKMVKGRSLAQILKGPAGGEYSLVRLLGILTGICNALSYAHSRNVIHRDLKPANIMVGDFGEVYVMDWGLAKTLGTPCEPDEAATVSVNRFAEASRPDSKVTTSRATVGDLTQAGSIMGTPAYMPPEQAQGENVDERADIYSLGAILYEIMTLTPPVGRGGDMMAIVMRVAEGKIDAPEKRAPQRARAGWAPPELAAIAMKALALKREDRYQSVEALKRDTELFLEGRSVSAKHDTAWEMFKKLVKRNKGVSIATAAGLLVVLVLASVFFKINYDARVFAEKQQAIAEKSEKQVLEEQSEKQKAVKHALPALATSARQLAGDGKLDEAQSQVKLMLTYDQENAAARLLQGQLLIAQERWAEGRAEIEQYLKQQPDDAAAKQLVALSRRGEKAEPGAWFDLARHFQEQKLAMPANQLLQKAQKEAKLREPLLALYRKQIESQWPGAGIQLGLFNGVLRFDSQNAGPGVVKAKDLRALQGIPLDILWIEGSYMPLVEDISALRGVPLKELTIGGRGGNAVLTDLEPLRGMPLRKLNLFDCKRIQNLEPLSGLRLTYLNLNNTGCFDLEPLTGMPLTYLNLGGLGGIADLTPLSGMPLNELILPGGPRITNLEALRGVPLVHLSMIYLTRIKDLSPLEGMKLKTLELGTGLFFEDAEALRGMPLEGKLALQFGDISALKGMKLSRVTFRGKEFPKGMDVLLSMATLQVISWGGVDYPSQEFWKKYDAGEIK